MITGITLECAVEGRTFRLSLYEQRDTEADRVYRWLLTDVTVPDVTRAMGEVVVWVREHVTRANVEGASLPRDIEEEVGRDAMRVSRVMAEDA